MMDELDIPTKKEATLEVEAVIAYVNAVDVNLQVVTRTYRRRTYRRIRFLFLPMVIAGFIAGGFTITTIISFAQNENATMNLTIAIVASLVTIACTLAREQARRKINKSYEILDQNNKKFEDRKIQNDHPHRTT